MEEYPKVHPWRPRWAYGIGSKSRFYFAILQVYAILKYPSTPNCTVPLHYSVLLLNTHTKSLQGPPQIPWLESRFGCSEAPIEGGNNRPPHGLSPVPHLGSKSTFHLPSGTAANAPLFSQAPMKPNRTLRIRLFFAVAVLLLQTKSELSPSWRTKSGEHHFFSNRTSLLMASAAASIILRAILRCFT